MTFSPAGAAIGWLVGIVVARLYRWLNERKPPDDGLMVAA